MVMLLNLFVLFNDVCWYDLCLCVCVVGGWMVVGFIVIVVGLVVGGLLIVVWGWCGIFFVNLLLCVVGFVVMFVWVFVCCE